MDSAVAFFVSAGYDVRFFRTLRLQNRVLTKEKMSDSIERKPDTGRRVRWDFTLAFLVLRLWLGCGALFVGVGKFGAYRSVAIPLIDSATGKPDASGVMVNVNIKSYALDNYTGMPASLREKFYHEPLLPKLAVSAFDHMLGPAFVLTGIMLLIGFGTRVSLLAQGLLYVALTVGLILIDQNDGVAYLGIHVGLIALALLLVENNRFVVFQKC